MDRRALSATRSSPGSASTTTYYDPLIGGGIAALMQPNTRVVFTESPGSLSFEMQDIPAIAEAAHAKGALVLMDNTWATPLYFRALDHGVDLSIQAGTKYIGGHSDVMLGTVAANSATVADLRQFVRLNGLLRRPRRRLSRPCAVCARSACGSTVTTNPDLPSRAGSSSAPRSCACLHPAMPSHPGHALWKRDFTGASGLFSIVLKPVPQSAVYAFLDALELFGIGASWGGYESLAIPFDCTPARPQRAGRRAVRRCASTSASKPSTISLPTSSTALLRSLPTPRCRAFRCKPCR